MPRDPRGSLISWSIFSTSKSKFWEFLTGETGMSTRNFSWSSMMEGIMMVSDENIWLDLQFLVEMKRETNQLWLQWRTWKWLWGGRVASISRCRELNHDSDTIILLLDRGKGVFLYFFSFSFILFVYFDLLYYLWGFCWRRPKSFQGCFFRVQAVW